MAADLTLIRTEFSSFPLAAAATALLDRPISPLSDSEALVHSFAIRPASLCTMPTSYPNQNSSGSHISEQASFSSCSFVVFLAMAELKNVVLKKLKLAKREREEEKIGHNIRNFLKSQPSRPPPFNPCFMTPCHIPQLHPSPSRIQNQS